MIEIKSIPPQQTLTLRHQVLWPDKDPEYCLLADDAEGLHYGLFYKDDLICVASVFIANNSARLRKFATASDFQGRGFGSQLITFIVSKLEQQKVNFLCCDARETAMSFYRRLGLTPSGKRFYKSDVAYFKMERAI